MRQLLYIVFCLQLMLIPHLGFANSSSATQSDNEQVKEAYNAWVKAVETANGNATQVAALYAADAILLPTLSPEIRLKLSDKTSQELYDFTSADIREYFVAFTKLKNLQAQTEQLYTQIFNDTLAINTGLYTFDYLDDKGKKIDVPARFTFVYEKINGKWLIISHHSSTLPEGH